MAESPVDSRPEKSSFPFSKKTGLSPCCGTCEPKPVTLIAKLSSWLWEQMVVCGGVVCERGMGTCQLGLSSMNMQVTGAMGKLSAYGHQIYYQGKWHALCAEPAGHLSGGELRLKASCSTLRR